MKHKLACLPFLVAAQSLSDRRRALWKLEAYREHFHPDDPEYWATARQWLRKETRVNKALARKAKWRKRGACENCRRAARRLEA